MTPMMNERVTTCGRRIAKNARQLAHLDAFCWEKSDQESWSTLRQARMRMFLSDVDPDGRRIDGSFCNSVLESHPDSLVPCHDSTVCERHV